MFIIECLPLVKTLNRESLSYFGPKHVPTGSIVKVNVRNREIRALVLESREAINEKAEIKTALFQIKKIDAVTARPFLETEFLEAVKDTAEYFGGTTGGILLHLLPSFILENPSLLSSPKGKENVQPEKAKKEISILQTEDEERFMYYRSLIREQFAKNKSVFICFPKNEDVKYAKSMLERGIESYVVSLHGDLNDTELKKEFKKTVTETHPILILATPRWLFIPRKDIGTLILDRESENGWKTISRPYFDFRFFAEVLAKRKNIPLVMGDIYLRTETLYRYKQSEIVEYESLKWRVVKELNTTVVDLRQTAKKQKEFKVLSPELHRLLQEVQNKKSNIFLFAARKGLSSVTICRDCGEQVKCGNCSSPMVLYKTRDGGAFKCHQCGETRDAAEVCQNCNSWKLSAFGAGIDRVSEEIKESFPDLPIFEIHKDATSTGHRARITAKKFYETKGAVMLGTEMAYPYLYKKITNTAIASFDSLFSIPDFRIKEKIFHLILQTIQLSKENFLIQSRNPDDPTVTLALAGNLSDFYKKEIEDRKVLNYPPFGVFIKITMRGTKTSVTREFEYLKNIFTEFPDLANIKPVYFPSIHEKRGLPAALNAVIKIERVQWPHAPLLSILKSLPPQFEIKIDPDNLL